MQKYEGQLDTKRYIQDLEVNESGSPPEESQTWTSNRGTAYEPARKLEGLSDQMMEDEFRRLRARFQELGPLERQSIDTDQAVFGSKMYLWGKLYGLIIGTGATVVEDLADHEAGEVDRQRIELSVWNTVVEQDEELRSRFEEL